MRSLSSLSAKGAVVELCDLRTGLQKLPVRGVGAIA